MLNQTIRKISLTVVVAALCAGVGATGPAHAHSSCTPAHLVSTLRNVEAKCGSARIVSEYRRGAVIAGTHRASQHSFCNGTNGAIDATFRNRSCALSALRGKGYTILTYRWSPHIHIGTDGWRRGGTRLARNGHARMRVASRRRAHMRAASRSQRGRVSHRHATRASYRHVARASHGNASHGNASHGRAERGSRVLRANARAEYTPRTRGRSARNRHGRSGWGRIAQARHMRVAHHRSSRGSRGGWNTTW
jgi:hypothetical protein